MKPTIQVRTSFIVAVALCMSVTTTLQAQIGNYPAKPIRLIVPWAPGGTSDVPWRIVAPRLSLALGQQVVIDNRPGAAGTIGAALASKAPPDGYTLLGTSNVLVLSAGLYKQLPYHALNDFVPIAQVAETCEVFVVHPSLPVRSVKEFVAFAKSKPGKIDYASSGTGSAQHLSMVLFASTTGINVNHVPFKSIGQSIPDLIAGRVVANMAGVTLVLPHVRAGRLRALAVTSPKRSQFLPEAPTVIEAGVKGFEVVLREGMLGPRDLSPEIVSKLEKEILQIMSMPDVQKSIVATGNEPISSNAEQSGAFLKSEFAKWTKLVTSLGIQAD